MAANDHGTSVEPYSPGIVQIGVDRWRAPLSHFEALHAVRTDPLLLPGLEGWVPLATCHRLELYLEGGTENPRELFFRWLPVTREIKEQVSPHLVIRPGEAGARHLLRTAAGLESVLLGEDQILAQIRMAYRSACERNTGSPLLHRLFHAALRAGRRVRGETTLNCGTRSLAGEAVALLHQTLGSLRRQAVMVIGTGSMGELACRRLRERGVRRLFVAGRSWLRTQELACVVEAEACPWSRRRQALGEVNGVITASGAKEPVIEAAWLAEVPGLQLNMTVIDLGVPRNVEVPAPIPPGLVLVDLEALSHRLVETRERRDAAIAAAEEITENEFSIWRDWAQGRVQPDLALAPGRKLV